ncbi:MAG: ABC transporter ATP-binding protein [Candidatus Hodarchaeota archaeon]
MSFLQCHDLIKIYTNPELSLQVAALRGVELSIKAGSLAAIIGTSGSGKSTLISLIGGMDKPSSGQIFVEDMNVTTFNKRELQKYRQNQVGFVFQHPEQNLIWNTTVLGNILMPMKMSGKLSYEERKKRARSLLESVDLTNKKYQKASQLSGGEAQRTAIATALANDPILLLADEPTGDLDSLTTFRIMDYFREINRDLGKTIIVVTHDQRITQSVDLVFRIQDGRVSELVVSKRKGYERADESVKRAFIFVDQLGNLRLPENLRKKHYIKNKVILIDQEDHIAIYPVKEEEFE